MMFTFILLILLYLFSQCFAIFGLINLDMASIKIPIPITIYEVRFGLLINTKILQSKNFLTNHK